MNLFGIPQNSYQLIESALKKYPQIDEVIIFGSRAKGIYKPGSDIDLALKGDGCDEKLALTIAAYLNEELPLPYFVDVVSYSRIINNSFEEHIDRAGKKFLIDS